MPAKVELRNVSKAFGDARIIQDVSLTIQPGEFVVLVGPSGCGKSTLLRMIAGLEAVTDGQLLFDDAVVNTMGPADRRVGMVFQSYALYPHMTVAENIGFGLKLAKVEKAERQRLVSEALDVLQLSTYRDHRPSQLSGGQRQRVAIGRAIVRDPNVFLFDEPLSNLDTALRVAMRMEIGRLHRRLMNTVVYVTHDQAEAMTLADRIVVMEAGRVRQIGAPLDLYRRPANQFVAGFIGTPGMGFLTAAVAGQADDRLSLTLADRNGGDVRLSTVARDLPSGATAVTIGVRPEDCWLVPAEAEGLRGEVLELERLGADTFAFLEVPSASASIAVRIKDGAPTPVPGEIVKLGFDADALHVFDAEGEALFPTNTHSAGASPSGSAR